MSIKAHLTIDPSAVTLVDVLARDHDVTLYKADLKLGDHSNRVRKCSL